MMMNMMFGIDLHGLMGMKLSGSTNLEGGQFVSSAGEAITLAQDVAKTMLAKGYVLGKEASSQAKAFDESHQVSATAAAKVAEFSERIGLTDKICAGVEAVKSVDEHGSKSRPRRRRLGRDVTGAAKGRLRPFRFKSETTDPQNLAPIPLDLAPIPPDLTLRV